jgi:5-methylcytosine-specific restriction enzyme subunit McrC
MTHHVVREWGHLKFGANGFTREHADALHAAALAHPLANRDATNILVYRRDRLVAQQMVGLISAQGCSLEILPKVDPEVEIDEAIDAVRHRLVRMLDVALDLKLDIDGKSSIDRQQHTLLDILIRAFADKLLAEVRRGLPRRYQEYEDNLPALRGRLDVAKQFTRNAVRPDRLACRFDHLVSDTPLMRIMLGAVVFLRKYARASETKRKLDELRYMLADIPFVSQSQLPWKSVRIDRINRRWDSLFSLAQLLIRREWQATNHAVNAPEGLTLLFPMNDLFETYIIALLRKALAESGIEVVGQGGHRSCLGPFSGEHLEEGNVFRTKPDIILRKGSSTLAIIDTKWKNLAQDPLDRKFGVKQSDVYQLMAYARLYPTRELLLLYPEVPGRICGQREPFGMVGGRERLSVATIDVSCPPNEVVRRLGVLCENLTNSVQQQERLA